jgi:carboxypeptidase Taq
MTPETAYTELLRRSRERAMLASCLELMGWDELTYMPRGGVENRGREMAHLAGLYHAALTDPRIGELLDDVADSPLVADPHSPAAANVRQWRREFQQQTRLPRTLVEELASVTTTAQQQWAEARQDNDFAQFAPWLAKVVALNRQKAECLGHNGNVYDALLEEHEHGMRSADLKSLFAALRQELTAILTAVGGTRRKTKPSILRRDYPVERQRIFAEAAAGDLGFDFSRGRLDATTHPFFSTIGPGDCRITTRYTQTNFGDAFFAMLHEMGHGLYEQGLAAEHYGTPAGEATSMALHESQSRMWETFVGRSRSFWQHFFPRAREVFHDTLHDVKLDQFYGAINHVEPGVNRVRADAVSYDLHIAVRFELEQELIVGDLPVEDLPAAWNAKYREFLNITPPNDAEGCLQDSHWAAGLFGYFPVYTLGNIYAAQIFATAQREVSNLDADVSQGKFEGLLAWLQEKMYRHGGCYAAAELLEKITGQPADYRPLVAALQEKCGEVYGV